MIDATEPPGEAPGAPDPTPPPEEQEASRAEPDEAEALESVARILTGDVKARNALIGNRITVHMSLAHTERERPMVQTSDLGPEATAAAELFCPPDMFDDLVARLSARRVVVLAGARCGKRTAAIVALLRTEPRHEPILELPADMPVTELVDAVKQTCDAHPTAGLLIESVDAKTASELVGPTLDRLQAALGDAAALVLTSQTAQVLAAHDERHVVASSPDAERIVRKRANARYTPEPIVDAVLAAIAQLPPDLPPATVTELFATATRADLEEVPSPEELAAGFARKVTDEALERWFASERSARQLAALAAAATLDGAPATDVDAAAEELDALLAGPAEAGTAAPKAFGIDRGWPEGIIARNRGLFWTHFGRQEAEIVEICAPHSRDRVVAFLWRRLGADFRSPFIAWLRALGGHARPPIRGGAATTAGILFVEEPDLVQRELIHPWAIDGGWASQASAARALGVPVVLGADPAPARALVRKYETAHDLRLRSVAVRAYGDAIGAWDVGSAAPLHLWRIGAETPELQRLADRALAQLAAGGEAAARARATVLGVLAAQAEQRRPPERAYRLLPLLLRALTADDEDARRSLAALLGEAESPSRATLATLLAQAFHAPAGVASAREALSVLLAAVASGHMSEASLIELLQAVVGAAPDERRARIDAQLAHALRRALQGDGPLPEIASSVLSSLSSSTERTPDVTP